MPMRSIPWFLAGLMLAGVGVDAQGVRVVDLGGGIFQAAGAGIQGGTAVRVPQSNTFLVVTSGGNVVVDTSIAAVAGAHRKALSAVNGGPIQAIILTHAHGDHTGGIPTWREPATKVIVHGYCAFHKPRSFGDGDVGDLFAPQ
jgi:glyoxylase-like metal-dependent hydrolase (beta-lactamase superfamily II)